jgi:multidrug efflux pump subunit AcrA (membrane-fusion protein)
MTHVIDCMKGYRFQKYAMKNHLRHGLVIAGVFCLIVIALIVGALRPKRASGAAMQAPPDILVAQVEQQDVPIYGEWIGTLAGQVNANVQAQVSGYLLERDYQEGSTVRA